jgi:[acyl-carrier-protein] S-malonyltransferase
LPGVETLALKTPDDLDTARAFVDKHAAASPLEGSPTWRLIVSPGSGTVRVDQADVGTHLESGAVVGAVMSRRGEAALVALHGGTIVEWLVHDGDPVSPGQPLVRLYPEGVPA